MLKQEIILRFLSFIILTIEDYKGDMDDFLSNTMEKINSSFPTACPDRYFYPKRLSPAVRSSAVSHFGPDC